MTSQGEYKMPDAARFHAAPPAPAHEIVSPSLPVAASSPSVVAAAPAARAGLGIGVITYNRLATLKETLAAIEQFTQAPHSLVVADDGSTDWSADWAKENGYSVMSGPNGGPGINKNRALFYLMTQTLCDPIILIEEDFRPTAHGWEAQWIEAAALWHHVNVILPEWGTWLTGEQKGGAAGTPADPIWWEGFTGQCTVTSRAALKRTGYLDPLLRGFGEEHVEWTRRIGRLLHWPLVETPKGIIPKVPQIYTTSQVTVSAGTYFDNNQTRFNKDTHDLIKDGPLYRPPFRSQKDRTELMESLAACIVDSEYMLGNQ